ncbi:MAG: class I SAM-dependent methyltransferase [Polyangiales bacterium]
MQRDREHVLNEYDVDSRNEYWDSELSLDQLIYGDDRTAKWLLKDGVLVVGIDRVSREYLTQRLLSRVSEYLPDGKGTIVEFGCGTGRNLFFLRRHFPEARLVGFELSPSTAARAQRDADAFGLDIEVIQADMT